MDTFITEKDIACIEGWGLDHVRLPVDYRILEDMEHPGRLLPQTVKKIESCIGWCRRAGLNLILDLHNAAGNVYGAMEEPMPLLTDPAQSARFLGIWSALAKQMAGVQSPVVLFELLNEVSDGSGFLWNELCRRTIAVIREKDPQRGILIGSSEQNSAFRLKELPLFQEPGIYYNFHFYDPQTFTHQRAHFSEEMCMYAHTVHYPGKIEGFTEFLQQHRQYIPKYARVCMEDCINPETMRRLMKDALDFARYAGKELYCGEFGVIQSAPEKDAAAWVGDCAALLAQKGIGCALWNYKLLDFGLTDAQSRLIRPAVLAAYQNA